MSTLYVVATPIGNLSDLTARAIEILSTVPNVAAEDTRVTRKLLNHIGASPKLESLHEHTTPKRLRSILDNLIKGNMAIVTDAGTPGISDPGPTLVRSAIAAGHEVVPIPGPSAVSTALSVTGWTFDRFLFVGFLPRNKSDRTGVLTRALSESGPVVIYESPHRFKTTITDISEIFADRQIVVCRELTKRYEEIFRGNLKEAMAHFTEPRGEFVIVIKGNEKQQTQHVSDKTIIEVLEKLGSTGLTARGTIERTVEITGAPKSRVYRLWLDSH